jgi:hypothetical protein
MSTIDGKRKSPHRRIRCTRGSEPGVFVHPATEVTSKQLSSDVGPFNFDTTGYFTTDTHLTKPLPIAPLLSTDVDAGESLFRLETVTVRRPSGRLRTRARTPDVLGSIW